MAQYIIKFATVDGTKCNVPMNDSIHSEVLRIMNPNIIVAPKDVVVSMCGSRPVTIKLVAMNPSGFTRTGIALAIYRLYSRLDCGELSIPDYRPFPIASLVEIAVKDNVLTPRFIYV